MVFPEMNLDGLDSAMKNMDDSIAVGLYKLNPV
jgi:hypothetical protein